jgi:uncharacterized protein DUF11/PASTA domain-containing protein
MGKRLWGLAIAAAVALFALTTTASAAMTLDAGVTTTPPSGATSGQPVVLASIVTNNGPDQDPITFTDTVPSGLTITSQVAGNGSCSVTGQKVTCIITLNPGQSAPVQVVVTPTAPGSYTNAVSVAVPSGDTDSNTTNDSASATFLATSIPPIPLPTCIVPNLTGTPVSVAKEVLVDLSCTPSVIKKHTGLVPKGLVIRTNPDPGGYPGGTNVRLVVSSGPRKHHSTKHH